MFRVALCLLFAFPANAHEFWIAPQAMRLAPGDVFEPIVMIGEGLDGTAHPFQPLAYSEALWIGPNHIEPLHLRRISDGPPRLDTIEDGVHILAVATFPQTYIHPSKAEFDRYAKTEAMSDLVHTAPDGGPVRETYRRFSKTLIKAGFTRAHDRRVGLDYEWVLNSDQVSLYHLQNPIVGQKVRLTCRKDNGNVLQEVLVTDQTGTVPVEVADTTACLLSAVMLEDAGGSWTSNWVSIHF